jgi:hypothetical protein
MLKTSVIMMNRYGVTEQPRHKLLWVINKTMLDLFKSTEVATLLKSKFAIARNWAFIPTK